MAIRRIQLRRGTKTEWDAANPILAIGEPGFERDTGKLKIGNGADVWAVLSELLTRVAGNAAYVAKGAAQAAYIGPLQSTTTNGYLDLATPGPSRTVTTGSIALVVISARITNNVNNTYGLMSVAVSEASTFGGADDRALVLRGIDSGGEVRMSDVLLFEGLTPGVNTFTAKYASSPGGTSVSFADRRIAVIPL